MGLLPGGYAFRMEVVLYLHRRWSEPEMKSVAYARSRVIWASEAYELEPLRMHGTGPIKQDRQRKIP